MKTIVCVDDGKSEGSRAERYLCLKEKIKDVVLGDNCDVLISNELPYDYKARIKEENYYLFIHSSYGDGKIPRAIINLLRKDNIGKVYTFSGSGKGVDIFREDFYNNFRLFIKYVLFFDEVDIDVLKNGVPCIVERLKRVVKDNLSKGGEYILKEICNSKEINFLYLSMGMDGNMFEEERKNIPGNARQILSYLSEIQMQIGRNG